MAESIVTTLLQATKNELELYFCFIGDAEAGSFFTIPLPMAVPIRAVSIKPDTSRGGSGGKAGKL